MVTDSPLLTTKLQVPQVNRNLITRPRLINRLNEGLKKKLTLVSAPAGYGRTTLVSEWCAIVKEQGYKIAWFAPDDRDNDHVIFLRYLVATLKSVHPDIENQIQPLLELPQVPPIESVLTTLLNQIAEAPDEFTLVLEGYHNISAEPVHQVVAYLLEFMPSQMHLVITSRTDPPLSLARLRARGQMNEIHAQDLRFTQDETRAFLQLTVGLTLSPADLTVLEKTTEGWIAAIQLAALSMNGHSDIHLMVESVSGRSGYIFEYLAEEVLYTQEARVQEFLLKSSILERLSWSLCEAVTGRGDSQDILEWLVRANLFLVELDGEGRWYRYSHLFREFLYEQLQERFGDQVEELQANAVNWYERNQMPAEAIHHALDIDDFERAAEIIESVTDDIYRRGEIHTLRTWMKPLPEDLIRSRPRLSVAHALTLYFFGDLALAEERLLDAENTLSAAIKEKEEVWTEAGARPLLGKIKYLQAHLARNLRGDWAASFELSNQALELLPEEYLVDRSMIYVNLGHVHWQFGDLDDASEKFADAGNLARSAEQLHAIGVAESRRALVRIQLGRLREAAKDLNETLEYARAKGGILPASMGEVQRVLAMVLREWNDLDMALLNADQAIEVAGRYGYVNVLSSAYVVRSWVRLSQGDVDAAIDAMGNSEKHIDSTMTSEMNFNPEPQRVRLWLAQGDLLSATRWAERLGLSPEDEIKYALEEHHIAYSRVLIMQDKPHDALSLLNRLLEAAEAGGRTGRLIQILVLKALAHRAENDMRQATAAVTRALTLAEPEGYVRVFVDEGTPMEPLLRRVASQGIAFDYISKLLSAFRGPAIPVQQVGQPLIETLSDRELEVLKHIVRGMSNKQVSENLFISISTVKTHVNNIFRKLDVVNRTEAIAKATELDLLQ